MSRDLFGWTEHEEPVTATIIAWPLDRDVGRVRHVASLLTAKTTTKQRDTYWRTTCNRLADTLLRRGLNEDQVAMQLDRFHAAVSLELTRQSHRTGREHG